MTDDGAPLVEERVAVGPVVLTLQRPPSVEALIDERAFDDDEFLPYWAEPWPSGLVLAQTLAYTDLSGARVVEIGCGLGIPSLVAALRGARVVATDWSEDALRLLRANAARNGVPELGTARLAWTEEVPEALGAPFDLVLAADVLYERRNLEPLLALLPRLGREVWLADPGRPAAGDFLERARAAGWLAGDALAEVPPRITVHRLHSGGGWTAGTR